MIKTIIAFILFALVSLTVKSQHLIITNNSDSIEAKIIDRDDSMFHFREYQSHGKKNILLFLLLKS